MRWTNNRGYAMAALLVAMSVMAIMLGVALPVWRTAVLREREAELVFRGEQYVQAINLFSRRNGGYPTSLDALRAGRYIRKLYKDPITDGDFQPVYLGQIATATPGPAPQGVQGAQAGLAAARAGLPGARAGQPPAGAGRGIQAPAGIAGGVGQPAGLPGQPSALGAGPIIGVVSKSTGEALRLYNGRGHYNEWLFVSTAATQQAGAPAGGQTPVPPGRGGRGAGPAAPGRGAPAGRGVQPRGGPPGGTPSPFGRPGGFPFPMSPNQPGR
jgi:type II secretory pathway pseudopilin PulG